MSSFFCGFAFGSFVVALILTLIFSDTNLATTMCVMGILAYLLAKGF